MNSVILIGHVGDNPIFHYENKELCCTFNFNVQRTLNKKHHSNRRTRKTCRTCSSQTIDSIPVVLWEQEARFTRRHFNKDNYAKHLVMITGEIHICYYYEDNRLKWTPKVIADNIVIVD